MSNLRLVLAIDALLFGIALALFLAGFVRLPAALTILALFGLIWALEILRFDAANANRGNRP